MLTIVFDPEREHLVFKLPVNDDVYYVVVYDDRVAVTDFLPQALQGGMRVECLAWAPRNTDVSRLCEMNELEQREEFWEQINPHLDDPFIDFTREPSGLRLETGTEEQFYNVVSNMVAYFAVPTLKIVIDDSGPDCDVSIDNPLGPTSCKPVLDAILEYFRPAGRFYEYNDGPTDQVSGYIGEAIEYEFRSEDSARERLAARIVLERFLAEIGKKDLIQDEIGIENDVKSA